MNKKGANYNLPTIILGVLFVVAVIVIIFVFYNSQNSNVKTTTTKTNSQKTQGNTQQSAITNCGNSGIQIDFSQKSIEKTNENNYNCFNNLIETCQKAGLTYEIEVRGLLGVNQKYSHYYELKGFQSGKCVLYVKMNSYDSFSYTDKIVQSFLDGGMSQEEINQQEQKIFEGFQQLVGRDGVCKYSDTANIKDYFDKFAEGEISGSTEGFPNAECSGPFFEFVETTP
ncbi:hypothetical protein HYV50_01690 [Candidatus Pacearchaeota archaeon]|nr:hypothetical protein [Candidatus Pacearchaeota archaeon]